MSFTHKWLAVTFVTQLLVSALFLGVYFHRMTGIIESKLEKTAVSLNQEYRVDLRVTSDAPVEHAKQVARSLMLSLGAEATAVVSNGAIEQITGTQKVSKDYLLHADRNLGTALVSEWDDDYLLSLSPATGEPRIYLWLSKVDVFRERDNMIWLMVAFVLISAVSASLFLAGYGNRLSNRLLTLRKAALELAAGRQVQKTGWKGNDELAVLAHTFDQMSEAIRQQIDKVTSSATRLEKERNRLDFILSSLNEGVIYMDAGTRVLYCNQSLYRLLALRKQDVPEHTKLVDMLKSARLSEIEADELGRLIIDELCLRKLSVELELENGSTLDLRYIPIRDGSEASHALVMVRDISIQKNVQVLKEAVERDPLTRVMNRRGFELTLQALQPKVQAGLVLGLIYVDLDGFKSINDTLGHKAGDQVLKTAAQFISGACRKHDVVARLGGDEFAVIIHKATWPLLENISNRILEAFESSPMFQRIFLNHQLKLGCSLGVAHSNGTTEDLLQLVERADKAMYVAKRRGKGQFCTERDLVFDSTQPHLQDATTSPH